jgi:hypothetical protein
LWFAYLSRSKRVKATYSEWDGPGNEYNASEYKGSEYIGLNLSRPAPRDPARDAPPQQPKTDASVEPVNQASEPTSEQKFD